MPETTFYPALSVLLNAVGQELSPKVRCVINEGKGGVTMPGKGKLADEGGGTVAVFLNAKTCWRGIPRPVWEFTIGGYQVIKKWLSYREKDLLGRGLTLDEVNYVTEITRRLAALVAMQGELDGSYKNVAAHCQ